MLNPPAPYANCSYDLQFYGPSLSCGSATSTNTTRIAETIYLSSPTDPKVFVSFVPMIAANDNETDTALDGLRETLKGGSTGVQGSTYDYVSNDHGRVYFVINDRLGANIGGPANKTIECGLYNTSYNVDFAFSNGQPNLSIVNAKRLNGVASDATLAMCNSGTTSSEAPVCSPEAATYIALLHAFGEQLLGYLQQSHYGHVASVQTQVAKTVFMDTRELYGAQYYMNHGKQADTRPADAMGIAEALEEVFTNVTLSLFSSTSYL